VDPLADLTSREGVASAMASARDGIDVLLRDRGLRKTTPDVAAESLLRGAWASAVLAGTTSDEDAFRAGDGDAVAQASLRLSTHVLGVTGTLTRSPLQALARLHAVAAADEPPDTVGRPRDGDSARRLADVAALLSRPTTAPGLVVAAIVHAEILSARPFATHNGLVARATERLILLERGVDRLGATVPEAGHLAARAAYEARIAAYAEASDSGDPRRGLAAAHAWLLYAAEAYSAGADHSPLLR
jgi:hypothetical protein